jgi:hypothetical protein
MIVLLAAAAVFALAPWREGVDLDEGATRFVTLVRMARADAANTGRRVRLEFDADTGRITVTWEPSPLERSTASGGFVAYASPWSSGAPNGLVRVVRCELTGDSAWTTMDADAVGRALRDDVPLSPVTFYPDGSSDSALIELAPATEAAELADARRAVVEIDGVNQIVAKHLFPDVDAVEAFYEEFREAEEEEQALE